MALFAPLCLKKGKQQQTKNKKKKRSVVKINHIAGREIFSSSGEPTLCCDIILEDGKQVVASIPSDPLMEQEGYFVCYDGGSRCGGKGMQKAVSHIDSLIAPAFLGKEPDLFVLDAILSELDGTSERSTLGANVTLVTSMAICKAQAIVQEAELFETIAQLQGSSSVSLPFPLMTVISGGKELQNGFPFEAVFLVPVGAQNYKIALEYALVVFHDYKKRLKSVNKKMCITDCGGISSFCDSFYQPIDLLIESLKSTGLESYFVIGFDAKADTLYDSQKKLYEWAGKEKTAQEMILFYQELCGSYPVYSLENALSWQDIEGSRALFETLGSSVQIAMNEGFVHSATLLQGLDAQCMANASIIRLAGASTVSELLESISFCQSYGLNTVISVGQGETEETFLADLAVGTSSGQVQAGGGARSEFMAKYNRLLYIEDFLASQLLDRA